MIKQTGILKKKAFEAVIALGIKRVIVQAIFTISNIFLARLLFPADFGMFAIVTMVGSIFSVFADIGLGPALIQKKDKIATRELQTVFTFQFSLSFLIFLLINLIAPYAAGYYGLGDRGTLLFHVFSFYFLFGPFKTTSGAILERNLDYRRLVIVELAEIFTASMSTVILAIAGFGVFSFVIGGICGHVVGATFYFIFSPWPVRFNLSLKTLRSLSRFGLNVQINGIFGLFYGPLVLLYLGKQVGAENLGFYQFAASLSVLPLAFSEIVNRIAFPLGARVQADKVYFKKIVERSLAIVSATTLPLVFVGIAAAPAVVHFIYTDRWTASLPAIYLGLVQIGFISYTGIFGQLLLSLGQSQVMRNMGLIWAVLTWVIAPILISRFNFVGMSLTALIVSASGLWLIFRMRREIRFSWWPNFLVYFISSMAAGFLAFILIQLLPRTFINLVFIVGFASILYLIFIFIRRKTLFIISGKRFREILNF